MFDLGGVLIDWSPRYLYSKIWNDPSEVDYFLKNICNMAWNSQQDAGRSFAEAEEVLIVEYPEYKEAIRSYFQRWPEMLNGLVQGMEEIFDDLFERYPLYALTNWSTETFPFACQRYDRLLNAFQDIVVSGEEKHIKPQEELFNILLTRNGLEARESVLIDDSLVNVETARQLGFTALHFVNAAQLKLDLQSLRLMD